MTTKAIIEELKCTKSEAPKKTLEKAFEILRTNEEVQAQIKDMVVTDIHIDGNSKAMTATIRFLPVDLVAIGDPIEKLGKEIRALFETLAKAIKEEKKEDSHD